MGALQDKVKEIQQSIMVQNYKSDVERDTAKYKELQDLDLFILDNSIRESTVGQTRGHTIDEKWKIYEEVKKCGFKNIIVASFSHMTRVDDEFCRQLTEKGEDLKNLFSFSEVLAGTFLGIVVTVSIGKCYNVLASRSTKFLEVNINNSGLKFTLF